MSREQDKLQCQECIKKLKKKLEENGFNILKVNDDILIKTPKRTVMINSMNYNNYNNDTTAIAVATNRCPVNSNGCINVSNNTCTYPGTDCGVDKHNCPICNGSLNNGNGDSSNTDSNSSNNNSVCLFRIRPTDIYNGIFLHAVTLYGDECDLKMTFGYDTTAVNQIISVLNFLV